MLSGSVTTEPQPKDELLILLSEFLSGHKSFTGTATELAEALEKRSEEPLVPAVLTKRLIHCRDELAACGITFKTHRTCDRRELRNQVGCEQRFLCFAFLKRYKQTFNPARFAGVERLSL